jgi:intracellular sulfur oxidation DsrE/DsrF family protein
MRRALQHRCDYRVTAGSDAAHNACTAATQRGLNNARNLQAEFGAANVQIEIVAYGPGIGMLKHDSGVGKRVGDAVASGVRVAACENTMRGQKLAKADMLNGVGYVPAGVVEITQKQQHGWTYLRP